MSTPPDILESHYPTPCPFCTIAATYPSPTTSPLSLCNIDSRQASLDCVPEHVNPNALHPSCFLVLCAPDVLAFLDVMPMTRGHLLVATRKHRRRLGELEEEEGRDMGYWLPILGRIVAKVTGCSDYNVVQNNGARAAQVVPHVHFHIIPRPSDIREIRSQSWTMFGRGQREELDEEEGEAIAAEMRDELRRELRRMEEGLSKI